MKWLCIAGLVGGLAFVGTGGAATSGEGPQVIKGTAAIGAVLHIAGVSRVWCSVQRYEGATSVLCFNRKGNRGAPGTYAFIASDKLLLGEHFDAGGHGTPVGKANQPDLSGAPGVFTGGKAKTFQLATQEGVLIAGTHLICYMAVNPQDIMATMYCEIRNTKGQFWVGSFGGSVSDHSMAVFQMLKSGDKDVFAKTF